ncbi:hypothetical protein SAMN06265337_0633 [Hymenobacter gelipurpurascens]|uniref:HTH cro/C1-type domain-containing protein n=1 Tax=Hymenobacter gelipurpurascens TaxID=89968 RepID=A0A212T8T6_9BACT|nr:helix-turn-helix transcriptional regulator [Hymenobacter gelipurpurascens]SNC62251.1 hypothetical protein SAMN06265337_0633 [Hymenobacter gelipurpurascens]
MKTINSRIAHLIAIEGLNNNSFAKRIGVSSTTISYLVGERQSRPGFDVIEKIAVAFPDINMDWLIRGTGPERKQAGKAPDTFWSLMQNERSRYGTLMGLHGSLSGDFDVVLGELKTASN